MAEEQLKDRIKTLRKAKKMTLEQLAEASDTAKSYIWELENRDNPKVSADKLAKIAEALEVTADFLLGSDEGNLKTAEDTAFFRQYSKMPKQTREAIRAMAKLLDKSGG